MPYHETAVAAACCNTLIYPSRPSMSQTYKTTGINLKSIPLGESDRILTILTRDHGMIRAVALGARKPKAKLGGRGELFVVNQLLLSQGRSLDKLAQAESIESYPALSRDLAKLTVAQYWAEMILYQAPGHDPTETLFDLTCHLLTHLAACPPGTTSLVHLVDGILQLLKLGGILPQVDNCCLTGQPIQPGSVIGRVIFSPAAGGVILPSHFADNEAQGSHCPSADRRSQKGPSALTLSPAELTVLQQMIQTQDPLLSTMPLVPERWALADNVQGWLNLERALRGYVQYYTERPIRSAALLKSCFPLPSTAVSAASP
jgi:DNA repair protein RecO (recombination protein O)